MSDSPKILDPSGQVVSGNATELRGQRLQLRSQFSLQTGTSVVVMRIPGTDLAYTMLPAEARLLGMQLICEAERAMGDAALMRVALEVLGASPAEAVELAKSIGGGTRAAHAGLYEAMLKAMRAEQHAQSDTQAEETDGPRVTH